MRLSLGATDLPRHQLSPPFLFQNLTRITGHTRRMGAPNGAPVAPPSTISSIALTYEESSEARKSTALASSSGSPHRPSGTEDETNFANLAESSAETEARGPRFQMGVLVGARCDHIHANVARCKVGGDGTRHRNEATLRGCVCGDAGLAEIVMYRPSKDDAAVVVQQRRR